MPACHAGGQGFEPPSGRHFFSRGWANAGVAQLAEQLICNQQVAGSSPIASFLFSKSTARHRCSGSSGSFMGRFPSGQREQTVNLPSLTSVVRIHPCPPNAGMAELADAHDSGSCARTSLQVQVLFPAPRKPLQRKGFRFFLGFGTPTVPPLGFWRSGCGLGMGHSASRNFCIRSALSLLMVSVT